MKQAIQLGPIAFKTKSSAQQQVKNILNNSQPGVPLEGESFGIICALLDRHPKALLKIGSGVRAIAVQKSGLAYSRCFMITRTDGTLVDFSYVRCFDGKSLPSDASFKKACRRSVAKDTVAFREDQFGGEILIHREE